MKKAEGNSHAPATSFSGLVDRIFQDNLSRFFDEDVWSPNGQSRTASVPVNIRQTDKSYELDVIAPGLKKEDFKINVSGDMLTVSFEHQEENKQQQEGWLRKEYKARSFSRSFSLNHTIDATKISAAYTDGVLRLSLPLKESAQPVSRTIEIE